MRSSGLRRSKACEAHVCLTTTGKRLLGERFGGWISGWRTDLTPVGAVGANGLQVVVLSLYEGSIDRGSGISGI